MRISSKDYRLRRIAFFVIIAALLFFHTTVYCQVEKVDNKTIDKETQAEIIDSVSAALNQVYVFPKVAKKMEKHMRKQFKKKAYEKLTTMREFTSKLTEDLQEISKDKHLRVGYLSDEEIDFIEGDTLTDAAKVEELKESQIDNFGFSEVKILDGNIGYINFRYFAKAEFGGPTAKAAMNFLAHTDAIIFDLRRNGGGNPSMIQLISSYLFEEPVHLNSFYIREMDSVKQFWTQSFVEGPRMDKTDVYVLTSKFTFSGAEEFAYNMKNLERGIVIGEVTGGGAHPVTGRYFKNVNTRMSLPFGRAINPYSGTNWEGVGVKPDIEVPSDEALDVAHAEALKKLKDRITDEDRLFYIDWALDGMEVALNPVTVDDNQIMKYAGTYGPRVISMADGELFYQRETNPKYKLIPMGEHKFMLDGLDYFRIQFVDNDNGGFDELIGMYDNGHTDGHMRTK